MMSATARLDRVLVLPLLMSLFAAPMRTVDAQLTETTSPWYGRLGYALGRTDGGVWSTRNLEGFEVAVGRSIGVRGNVRGAVELQGESLNKSADDLTCLVLIRSSNCAPRVPNMFLVTASGGLVLQQSILRIGAFVGPTLVGTSDAGRHGGISGRLQLAALLHPNFAIAAGVGTTRISSLQSTTSWIPRADLSLRMSLPR